MGGMTDEQVASKLARSWSLEPIEAESAGSAAAGSHGGREQWYGGRSQTGTVWTEWHRQWPAQLLFYRSCSPASHAF